MYLLFYFILLSYCEITDGVNIRHEKDNCHDS